MKHQVEARLDNMLKTLRTVRVAIEFREDWKDSMPAKLLHILDETISEEERMLTLEARDED